MANASCVSMQYWPARALPSRQHRARLRRRVHAAGDDERNRLGRAAQFVQHGLHAFGHDGKIEPRGGYTGQIGLAQVPGRIAWILDHDGVGQALMPHRYFSRCTS